MDTKLRLKKVFIDRFLPVELNRFRENINTIAVRVDLMSADQYKAILSEKGRL